MPKEKIELLIKKTLNLDLQDVKLNEINSAQYGMSCEPFLYTSIILPPENGFESLEIQIIKTTGRAIIRFDKYLKELKPNIRESLVNLLMKLEKKKR